MSAQSIILGATYSLGILVNDDTRLRVCVFVRRSPPCFKSKQLLQDWIASAFLKTAATDDK